MTKLMTLAIVALTFASAPAFAGSMAPLGNNIDAHESLAMPMMAKGNVTSATAVKSAAAPLGNNIDAHESLAMPMTANDMNDMMPASGHATQDAHAVNSRYNG